MRSLIAACLFASLTLGAASGPAGPDGRPALNLTRLFPFLAEYFALPEADRSHFTVDYLVTSTDGAGTDFDIWFEIDGERISIDRAETGAINTSAVRAYFDADPMVMTTLAPGAGSVNVSMSPLLPEGPEIALADIQTALDQVNSVLITRSGLAGIAQPQMTGVLFELPPGTAVAYRPPEGETVVASSAEDQWAIVPADFRDMRTRVVFSQAPLEDRFTQ